MGLLQEVSLPRQRPNGKSMGSQELYRLQIEAISIIICLIYWMTEGLARLFVKIKPDVVIHPAAIANIDFCQKNQSMAKAINVDMTKTIAGLCKEAGIRLIHCSTDTVFDGIKGYYSEEDLPNPVNFYAETKLQAEKVVQEASSRNVVARLSLVMGL